MADHLSIGEVLALLQVEFPDVTISKIRFLEAQGLLVPERTPSGYRKFHEPDIERLRWILVQQRENFLPLKVIKDRLQADGGSGAPADAGSPAEPGEVGGAAIELDSGPSASAFDFDGAGEGELPEPVVPIWMTDLARQAAEETGALPGAGGGYGKPGAGSDPADDLPASDGDVPTRLAGGAGRAERRPSPLDGGPTTVSLTAAELASAAGLAPAMVRELEQYGLLTSRPAGDGQYYDGDALVVAQRAAVFARHGVEARHLRMYKMAADREAGLLEQVTTPLMHQRHPQARDEALHLLGELASVGESLRAALLRTALRQHVQRD